MRSASPRLRVFPRSVERGIGNSGEYTFSNVHISCCDFDFDRDIEFDLENDREKCLHGVVTDSDDRFTPSDVQRVTQIFDDPRFFVDGADADSNDVVQGALGDCWFLSALATITMAKLVDKFCVAVSCRTVFRMIFHFVK